MPRFLLPQICVNVHLVSVQMLESSQNRGSPSIMSLAHTPSDNLSTKNTPPLNKHKALQAVGQC